MFKSKPEYIESRGGRKILKNSCFLHGHPDSRHWLELNQATLVGGERSQHSTIPAPL